MEKLINITGPPQFCEAARATADLLGRLGLEFAFVGAAAASAWLGEDPAGSPVDVLGLLGPDRMQQVPMIAANNGFEVNADSVERARELDLIPMAWPSPDGTTPVHVLLATNSLYSWMIRDSVEGTIDDKVVRIVCRSDWALLLSVDDRAEAAVQLALLTKSMSEVEIERLNGRLETIGLRERVVAR